MQKPDSHPKDSNDWERAIIPEYSSIGVINEDLVDGYEMKRAVPFIKDLLLFQERKIREELANNVGMLRQWLNEDRITDPKKMVTNEDLRHWLTSDKVDAPQKLSE